MWNPTKEEIGKWFETKLDEFPTGEIGDQHINVNKWLQQYIFYEVYEIYLLSLEFLQNGFKISTEN